MVLKVTIKIYINEDAYLWNNIYNTFKKKSDQYFKPIFPDVSFPLNHFKWNTSYSYPVNSSIEVSASSNVFVEKIQSIKTLDTRVFVANNQQSTTFTFPRKSGLEVKVRVSGIYLVPEYVDIEHAFDDSSFMKQDNSQPAKLKKRYEDIKHKYCRCVLLCLSFRYMFGFCLLNYVYKKLKVFGMFVDKLHACLSVSVFSIKPTNRNDMVIHWQPLPSKFSCAIIQLIE